MKAFTTVFQNLETGDYLVQASVMGPVSWTQFGEPITVSKDEFGAKITGAVLEGLDKFNREKFDPDRARKRTPKENAHFQRNHKSVSVTLLEDGDLLIRPLHKQSGGYVGHDKDSITLRREDVQLGLANALRASFAIAT